MRYDTRIGQDKAHFSLSNSDLYFKRVLMGHWRWDLPGLVEGPWGEECDKISVV